MKYIDPVLFKIADAERRRWDCAVSHGIFRPAEIRHRIKVFSLTRFTKLPTAESCFVSLFSETIILLYDIFYHRPFHPKQVFFQNAKNVEVLQ